MNKQLSPEEKLKLIEEDLKKKAEELDKKNQDISDQQQKLDEKQFFSQHGTETYTHTNGMPYPKGLTALK